MSITTNPQFEKAIGFLNLTLVTSNGDEIKLPKGVALKASNRTEKAIYEAYKANPDADVNVKVSFHAVDDTPLEITL